MDQNNDPRNTIDALWCQSTNNGSWTVCGIILIKLKYVCLLKHFKQFNTTFTILQETHRSDCTGKKVRIIRLLKYVQLHHS